MSTDRRTFPPRVPEDRRRRRAAAWCWASHLPDARAARGRGRDGFDAERLGARSAATTPSRSSRARSEMGQGVYTAMPTLVAEELEVDLEQDQGRDRAAGRALHQRAARRPDHRRLDLGARRLRQAARGRRAGAHHAGPRRGAEVGRRRVAPAARRTAWSSGPSGKKATYGELAAGRLEAAGAQGRRSSRTRASSATSASRSSVWTRRPRSTAPPSSASTSSCPGMLYAALAQCPVIGGKVTSFDAAKAKAMPGVKHVVQIPDGVAVVADTWWQAKNARDALADHLGRGRGQGAQLRRHRGRRSRRPPPSRAR